MWFKNLQVFRLTNWHLSATALNDQLALRPLQECLGGDAQSQGWVGPQDDRLAYSLAGHFFITLGTEKKLLPGTVVTQYTAAKAKVFEEDHGYRPSKKQLRDIKTAVHEELLRRAFVVRQTTPAWIDPAGGWLVVDSPSPARADELLTILRQSGVEFSATPIKTHRSPVAAMTGWLAGDELPALFSVDRDCELRAREDERAKVRYAHHTLDSEGIRNHISAGNEVTRLALTWADKISFVLHEPFQLKRLAFIGTIDTNPEDAQEAFESDMALMSGELSRLLPDLIDALGGEVSPVGGDVVADVTH